MFAQEKKKKKKENYRKVMKSLIDHLYEVLFEKQV